MSNIELVKSLLQELLDAVASVERLRNSPGEASMFLSDIGWPPPAGFDPTPLLVPLDISAELEAAQSILAELESEDADLVSRLPDLRLAVQAVVTKVRTIADPGGLPAPYDSPAFWGSFGGELISRVLRQHIESRLPIVAAMLQFVGVIVEEEVAATGARAAYTRRSIEWENLGRLFTEPEQLLRETYGWGSIPYRHDRMLRSLQRLLSTLHRLDVSYPTSDHLDEYYAVGNPDRGEVRELYGPLLQGVDTPTGTEFSLEFFAIPIPSEGDTNGPPAGLALGTSTSGHIESEIDVGLFDLMARGGIESAVGPRIEMHPGSIAFEFAEPRSTYDTALDVSVSQSTPMVLIGSEGGERLQLGKFSAGFNLQGTPNDPEIIVQIGMDDLEVVFQPGGGDSFLAKIFGSDSRSARSSTLIEWSTKHGLYFSGGASLGVTIPLHLEWGPVRVEEASVAIDALGEPFAVNVGLNAGLSLGPIQGTIDRVGVQFLLSRNAEGSGTFGDIDLDLGFLPPTGAGLSVVAGPVSGGGFLSYDEALGRYAGILDLRLAEIGLVAIALINTKLPGGKEGFALFVNIGVTFNPAITLPYNFTLGGVGGLLALNRSMDVEALRSGLRNRTLDSILFPEDPILNANKIINDSERVFPVEEGRFVIGPMVKIGWGPNGLIVADIAVVIELPMPIIVALLGQMKAMIPHPDKAVVALNLDILGVLDIAKKSLSIDATLYDSKIVTFDLWGDSALRLSWGSTPVFGMSLGGWHPRFSPPPVFPQLRRLTLQLSSSSSFKLTCTVYQALTSNTLQFGANARLVAKACGARVDGGLSFDTLITFSPFGFEIDMRARLSISYKGHDIASAKVTLFLSGPTPWRAKGKAKISIAWWDVTVRFSKTWGRDEKARLPAIDPLEPFLEAVKEVSNWNGALLPRRSAVESFKSLEAGEGSVAPELFVHPAGTLEVRQRLLPLGLQLEKYGNADVVDHSLFDLTLLIEGDPNVESADALEDFARGQFKELSKSDRLSKPSFEKFKAGVRAGPSLSRLDGTPEPCPLEYESILIQADGVSESRISEPNWQALRRTVRAAELQRTSLGHQGLSKFRGASGPRIRVTDDRYAIVDSDTLGIGTLGVLGATAGLTQTQAEDLVRSATASGQVATGSAIVVPEFETEAAQ